MRETVEALLDCLVRPEPGLTACNAAAGISVFAPAEHYVSVLRTLTADDQDPNPYIKNNVARFLWNFLATATAQVSTMMTSVIDL